MEWLKEHRIAAGMTQDELGEASGVDRSLISKLETGSANASPTTAKAIAKILKFDWTRFFPDTNTSDCSDERSAS